MSHSQLTAVARENSQLHSRTHQYTNTIINLLKGNQQVREFRRTVLNALARIEKNQQALEKKLDRIIGEPVPRFNPRVDTSTNTPPPAPTTESGTQSPIRGSEAVDNENGFKLLTPPTLRRAKSLGPDAINYLEEEEEEKEKAQLQGHDGRDTKI
jgi:hypothetical protein